MAAYLVTGGAGFIGSHLGQELIRRGHRVRIVDDFSTGKRRNVTHLPGAELVEGDLADAHVAQRAAAGMDYVLHQAAIPSVPRSVKDPVASNRANIDASLNMLVAARDAGVRRFVYAGSSSAYGNTPTLPKREDMPAKPLSPYALQKFVAEQVLPAIHPAVRTRDGDYPLLQRFWTASGPGVPVLGVISLFATALLEKRQPVIYGDGEQTRDFTYVANVVDGVLRACDARNVAGEVINVATGGRISLNELLRTMNRIVGSEISATYAPDRAGDVRDSQADIGRARALLGYEPIVDLEEGLRLTLAWCRTENAAAPIH